VRYETFAEWEAAVNFRIAQVWAQNGGGMVFDPINAEIGVGDLMHDDESLEIEVREAKLLTFQNLMDFIWADGPNPIAALKRLFVITRMGSPGHLGYMSQSDVAVLMNETRAATQSREERVWEKFLEQRGFVGTRAALKKGDAARATYREIQQGNVCRKGGEKARKKYSVLRNAEKTNQKNNKKKL